MGLLSLQSKEQGLPALQQAEQAFERAWQLNSSCYPAGYNLLMSRLLLGQFEAAAELVPQVMATAGSPEEQRFLLSLQALLRISKTGQIHPLLAELTPADEERLLSVIRGLGQMDLTCTLLSALLGTRPASEAIQEAYCEATLVRGKQIVDRCDWEEAERLLTPLVRDSRVKQATQAAFFNLIGCCACLSQDFEGGTRYFLAAAGLADADARICQNLGLVYEWQNQVPLADPHWNRYFDLLDTRLPAPPGLPDYRRHLAYEGLSRLAGNYAAKEQWPTAVSYLQRALRLSPRDADLIERLFHLYIQGAAAR